MTAPFMTPEEEARRRLLEEQGTSGEDQAAPAPTPRPSAPAAPAVAPAQPTGTPRATSTDIPSGFVPPPPPPPPPPPDLSGLTTDFTKFAQAGLSNPNPWNSDVVTAARSASEANLTQAEKDSKRAIDEWAQGRGLIGSSYEGDKNIELAGTLQRARGDFESNLLQQIATAEALSRQNAAATAASAIGIGENAGLPRYGAELDAARLAEEQRQFGGTTGLALQDIELRAQALVQQARTEGRTLDLQEARDQATADIERERLEQTGALSERELDLRAQALVQQAATEGRTLDLQAARDQATRENELAQLGISQQDVDLRARALQQEAQLQGRTLDLTEARDQASVTLQREQMAQTASFATADLAQRESEFARSFGLDEQEFTAQQENLTRQYGEQVATRLQQDEQFTATLASEDARAAVDAGLREKALELQKQGMDADTAFRTASLAQEQKQFQADLDYRIWLAETEGNNPPGTATPGNPSTPGGPGSSTTQPGPRPANWPPDWPWPLPPGWVPPPAGGGGGGGDGKEGGYIDDNSPGARRN